MRVADGRHAGDSDGSWIVATGWFYLRLFQLAPSEWRRPRVHECRFAGCSGVLAVVAPSFSDHGSRRIPGGSPMRSGCVAVASRITRGTGFVRNQNRPRDL
jgi:hypothetical protein